MDFDIIVIGSGPGGYVAAIRASQLGFKVAVVEKENLGGICLNWGCIPTKALLHAAHSYHFIKHKASTLGISATGVTFDIEKIVKYSRQKSKKLSDGVNYLMNKNKITVYKGHAHINDKKEVLIDDKKKITADHIIVATGASPRAIPHLEVNHDTIWNYRDAMVPSTLPKSMIVIGSGAIGVEFASFYNTLGTEVTIIEMQSQILPVEDKEIVEIARKEFEKKGIKILTDSKVNKVEQCKNEITLHIDHKNSSKKITADCVVVAAGVQGNSPGLGLEQFAKIEIENSYIKADKYGFTGEDGIYAIGDVTGAPCLAHKASHEGVICIEKIANKEDVYAIDKSNIPGCTYCDPQIASIGLTEEQAINQGYDIKVGRFKPEANGKSVVLEENIGLIKTVFDKKTGELLGAHMIGHEVTEMIQGYIIGKTMEATDQDFRRTIFPHPTLSEMMHESVLDADDEALHS